MCQIRAGDVMVGGDCLKLKSQEGKGAKGGYLKKGGAVEILQTIYTLLHSCDHHKKISINRYKRGD